MSLQREHPVACPCCGETIWLEIDCSLPHQRYVEDCQVCCRPLVIEAVTEAGEVVEVRVRPEND